MAKGKGKKKIGTVTRRCSKCHRAGHNARTCGRK